MNLTLFVLVIPVAQWTWQCPPNGWDVTGMPYNAIRLLMLIGMHPPQNLTGATLALWTRSCLLPLAPGPLVLLLLSPPLLPPLLLSMWVRKLNPLGGLFNETVYTWHMADTLLLPIVCSLLIAVLVVQCLCRLVVNRCSSSPRHRPNVLELPEPVDLGQVSPGMRLHPLIRVVNTRY